MSEVSSVSVRNLRKRYGAIRAAENVSFDIQPREIFGLLGPNGAGKTTTVECILGLRQPDAGTIEVCGIDARRRPRVVKEKIGASLQSTSLQDKITPREALSLFGAFYAQPVDPRRLLDRFSLTDKADAPFDSLSGGQRQRLALALAFVNNPQLVFLDEPTAGLDPQSRRELHADIAQMKRDGHTVLLTTHYIQEAQALCDRIAIIHHGHIVATGAPGELIAGSSSMQSVVLTTDNPLEAAMFARLPEIQNLVCEGTRATFRTAAATAAIAILVEELRQRQIEITELHVQKATLEDVFLQLTSSEAIQ